MNTQDRDLARSYAEAFYAAAFERWLRVLSGAADALALDDSLVERIQAEQTDFDTRKALLDGLLPADADLPVRNLLYTLVQRGDLGLLRDIIGLLAAAVARGREVTTPVEVVSAVPLTAEERAALTQKLTDQYGSGLEFTYRVDPTILGGLILRVGDKLIDGSVAGKLAAMKQALGVTVVQGEG